MKVTVKSAQIEWESKEAFHSSWDGARGFFCPEGCHVLQLTAEVDEFSPNELTGAFLGFGQELLITRGNSGSIQDIFTEACDNAKSGDTNALAALPYLAELLIKESNR